MISARQRLPDDETYSLNLPIHRRPGEDNLTKPAGSSAPTAIEALLLYLVNRILGGSSRFHRASSAMFGTMFPADLK